MIESSLHEMQTEAFISENSTFISFSRPVTQDDGAGGTSTTGVIEHDPVWCRVVGQGNRSRIFSENGALAVETVVVVGMPEMDVRVKDRFLWRGEKWEVVSVERSPDWAVRARAEVRG